MTTAKARGLSAALGLAAVIAAGGLFIQGAAAQDKTLRFVPEADLRSLDPIWTTAYITRNLWLHGLRHAVRGERQV